MKARYSLVLLALLLALSLTGVLWAREIPGAASSTPVVSGERGAEAVTAVSTADAERVRLALRSEPATVDPALATDTDSVNVVEQLFIGLTDLNDETGAVEPELATSWTISADGRTYTFTLRDDAYWSDGTPITAGDVRYGLLRTLNPANGAQYAYVLYPILNAAAYNQGTITDPNAVGIEVLDDTHLQIRLHDATSYFPAIIAMWMARPVPEHLVSAWGGAWTEPEHIVTSGPYRLSEWMANDHLLLEKSPTYYAADGVDIDQILYRVVDDSSAWQLYLNGFLDTATVPFGTEADAITAQQVSVRPEACVYYYGFSVTEPPFDDVLVRRAFSAATNRRGLVDDVMISGQTAALTVTPPTLFGSVDGYSEGIGYRYDPDLARQLLAAAGYPGGAGLPPIHLWFNTSEGHSQIAQYISSGWEATLGAEVVVHDTDWQDYLAQLQEGQFPVFRLGWCADYYDAYNFVGEMLTNRSRYGGWHNSTYDQLLAQARLETDPAARLSLYRQLEEIVVETDTVLIPLYHYGYQVGTKPYLERTYPSFAYDVAEWTNLAVSDEISATGGMLSTDEGTIALGFPADTFSETVTVTYAPSNGLQPEGNLARSGVIFDLTAVAGEVPVEPNGPYSITVSYDASQIVSLVEETLDLYYWNGSSWVAVNATLDTTENTLRASLTHFSTWAVLGETRRQFLPMLQN